MVASGKRRWWGVGGVWPLEVLIQMPLDAALDEVAQVLTNHGTSVQVFRDKDSSNARNVTNTWSKLVEKKA